MKILIITASYTPNTAFTNRLLAISKGLCQLEQEVELLIISKDRIDASSIGLKRLSVNIIRTNLGLSSLDNLISLCKLYIYLKKQPKDTVILMLGCEFYLPIACSIPSLKIFHERTEHPDVVRSYPSYWHNFYMNSLKKLSGLFVISTSLKKYFEDYGVKNVSIINMIVDQGRFENVSRNHVKKSYIAFCGNGSNNKDGVDILIKAFAQLAGKYPEMYLKIIGPAPKDYSAGSNKALVRELQLEDRVEFTGITPAVLIPQMLVDAEVLALARPDSLQAQCGFPTKLGEYLLSGRPVVVTNVGDIPKFLEHKKSALIAKHSDIDDFARCLLWVLDNPIESQRIGAEGKNVALASFNYLKEAKKLLNGLKN